MHSPLGASPLCPRCGYDQSGLVATWREAWPLEARCSECGLDYACEDAFRPGVRVHSWLYEHARSWSFGGWRALRTTVTLAAPWVFWRSVTLAHRTSLSRQLGWLMLAWFVPYLIAGAASMAATLVWLSGPMVTPAIKQQLLDRDPYMWTRPWLEILGYIDPVRHTFSWQLFAQYPFAVGAIAAGLAMPALLLMMSRSRVVAQVEVRHILRAGVYGYGWLAFASVYLLAGALFDLTGELYRPAQRWWVGERWMHAWGSIGTLVLWFAAYWYFAIVRGLRLPRARLVWCLLTVVGLLTILVVVLARRGLLMATWE